ncbi:MAG: hypothetical protein A2513_04390 [Sulfurimonas sp. RIFOXYD12_FULL_33_39]|uniref:hypothetical protein n=1 Tax=unclassified Sulfurimonas TaxID=2623549 RepID=UPI0008B318EB|nr:MULTISPECIES: hypothetical protein [unclassified Sulfurimonas]OHE09373.1 MAG: hypothetical protein A2513_04390 [Sulfurimonas sp. RIFOXYD12_FULL_33_39]OHE12845.1 MAG: hypothetical protein A2530_04415 [Sulfurimonas sp. RIFOXYD2_FULL_34_21]DAB27336.1 MAG TPA: hypothetical protein CFH78_08400 [Sulfurimonas sp. UBA10385]
MFTFGDLAGGEGGITPEFGDAESAAGSSYSGGGGVTTGDKYFGGKTNPNAKVSDQFLIGALIAVLALYVAYEKL